MKLNVPLKYKKDIELATNLLKDEGCKSVFLFGSLVTGKIHENSDIDIGIRGLAKGRFFSVYAHLDRVLINRFDLVDFDLHKGFYILLDSLDEVIELG
ncbi:MAG: nucleotidyltransferase domain-containing protein [Clostridiales bacterium]|jgi:predicted nucleotidyltransferase|nr:nucleotidyltransferase domain-containing protein [Clostridiales bacterium]